MSKMTSNHRIFSAAGITTLVLFSFGACVDFSEPPSGLPTGTGPVPGADGGTTEPDATSNPLPNGCGTGEKACNGGCVGLTDPAFGCGAPSCEPCSVGNGAAVCSAGACVVGTCTAPQADCDQKVSTGCETNVQTNAQHCGACGNACAAGEVCSAGACKGSCDQGLTKCGASCAEIKSDVQNCNGCGKACSAPANGSAVCAASTCGSQCNNGYRSCPGNTCKAESAQACGANCSVCAGPANGNGQAVCASGACKVQCSAGYSTCAEGCCKDAPVVPTAYKWGKIATGELHACAVTNASAVKCWGNGGGGAGRLGRLVSGYSSVPIDVVQLGTAFSMVGSGDVHSCAVSKVGAVKCWGDGQNGRLGNNSNVNGPAPVDVQGLSSGIVMASVGSYHTCALTTAGAVKCWGANDNGQLGNGTSVTSGIPVDVIGLSNKITNVASGSQYTCAVTSAGAVKCWGYRMAPFVGGDYPNSAVPVDMQGLDTGVVMVAAGFSHSCAVTSVGAVKCWGSNNNGRLGDGKVSDSYELRPVDVQGLSNGVAMVAAGRNHTCAVTTTGAVKCWGKNDYGQLGNSLNVDSAVPVDVQGLSSGVAMVAAGTFYSCALTTVGTVKCWGKNDYGQLGNNSTTGSSVPVDVVGF
jgi:alpha-tubulin suppressor-like RCC1 family protein